MALRRHNDADDATAPVRLHVVRSDDDVAVADRKTPMAALATWAEAAVTIDSARRETVVARRPADDVGLDDVAAATWCRRRRHVRRRNAATGSAQTRRAWWPLSGRPNRYPWAAVRW